MSTRIAPENGQAERGEGVVGFGYDGIEPWGNIADVKLAIGIRYRTGDEPTSLRQNHPRPGDRQSVFSGRCYNGPLESSRSIRLDPLIGEEIVKRSGIANCHTPLRR